MNNRKIAFLSLILSTVFLIAPISNATNLYSQGNTVQPPETIVQCDTNGDNQVSILDVVAIISQVLQGGDVITGTDCNEDGSVSILDVVAVINLVLSGDPSIEAPQNLNAISKKGTIEITWDSVNNAESYNLYHSLDANFPDGSTDKIFNVQSPYSLTGLANGLTYYLALTAVDAGGAESDFSNEQSVVLENDAPTGKLNDTGITFGGNYPLGNNDTCTGTTISAQDCSHGRDVTHNDNSDGHAGFSFTKLDASGNDLSASASQWSCVRDNVTGLIWEAKTENTGIHNKNNRYPWGGVTALGSGVIGNHFSNWNKLVKGSNAESLCGYSDWHVSTRTELTSLVDFSQVNKAIDVDYFPNTAPGVWSSSPNVSSTNSAWAISFYNGNYYSSYSHYTLQVRLVRSGQ